MDTEAFLNVFGKLTVANVVQIILAVAFLIYVGKKIRDYLIKRYEAEQRKDEQLHEALESVRKYPEYRKQSIAIQQKLEGEIQSIRKSQEESVKRLDEMEKDTKRNGSGTNSVTDYSKIFAISRAKRKTLCRRGREWKRRRFGSFSKTMRTWTETATFIQRYSLP